MNDYSLDGGQWEALKASAETDEGRGEDFSLACNVQATDHVHTRRIGAVGSGLAARVAIATHNVDDSITVFLAAPEARTLAAALLNAADEIDGVTPLVFFPPAPEAEPETAPEEPEEGEDVVEGEIVEEDEVADPYDAEALIGETLTILANGVEVRVRSIMGRLSTGEPVYRVTTAEGVIGTVPWSGLSDPEEPA